MKQYHIHFTTHKGDLIHYQLIVLHARSCLKSLFLVILNLFQCLNALN